MVFGIENNERNKDMDNIWMLAQEGEGITEQPVGSEQQITSTKAPTDPNDATTEKTGRSPFGFNQLIFMVLIFVVFYMLILRGPRKREQKQKQMVGSLKKNDKIRTVGGIFGTVVDVKPDEITIKVDESNNTKMKIIPSAVGVNLSAQGEKKV